MVSERQAQWPVRSYGRTIRACSPSMYYLSSYQLQLLTYTMSHIPQFTNAQLEIVRVVVERFLSRTRFAPLAQALGLAAERVVRAELVV